MSDAATPAVALGLVAAPGAGLETDEAVRETAYTYRADSSAE